MDETNGVLLATIVGAIACTTDSLPSHARSSLTDCGAATVWASPTTLQYRTVVTETEEHRVQPNVTAFIEPADGSAASLDPTTATLNGVSALPEPNSLGDANGNGIADVMLKFNRSVFFNHDDGVFTLAAGTASGGCYQGTSSVEIRCLPIGVERTDGLLPFITSNMPDPRWNDLDALLEVRRVKPVFPDDCLQRPLKALVLLHGRSASATAVFDLQYQVDTDGDGVDDDHYSLMETLALRGIDTFAPNHLGFGFSRITDPADPMSNPCNASLPQCTLAEHQYGCSNDDCSVESGCKDRPVGCDCRFQPNNSLVGQQVSTTYLSSKPLTAKCGHTSDTVLALITNQLDELVLIVNDAREKSGLGQVTLAGFATGGFEVGKYLGDDADYGVDSREGRAQRQANVERAIFMATSFGTGTSAGARPRQRSSTWPLGVDNQAATMSNFTLSSSCPGQQEPGIGDAIWDAIVERDPIGASWGPQPGGLMRYPLVNRFGWNATVAANITTPSFIIHGALDTLSPPATSTSLYDALAGPKIRHQVECASHAMLWEGCSGPTCNGGKGPHATLALRVGDYVLTGRVCTDGTCP